MNYVHPKLVKHRWLGYVLVTVARSDSHLDVHRRAGLDNTETKTSRTTALIAAINAAYASYFLDAGSLPEGIWITADCMTRCPASMPRKYYMTFNARDVNSTGSSWTLGVRHCESRDYLNREQK